MSTESTDMDEVKSMLLAITSKLDAMNDRLEILHSANKAMEQENVQIKTKIEEQNKRIEYLEREIRRNNIVIKGVEEVENENRNSLELKFSDIIKDLSVNLNPRSDIEKIHRIGKIQFSNSSRRPILVKLSSGMKKTEIMENTKKLKGRDIWIEEDYTKQIVDERKELVPLVKQARQMGVSAYIRYNKIIINGRAYGANDVDLDSLVNQQGEVGTNKRTVDDRSPGTGRVNTAQKKPKN